MAATEFSSELARIVVIVTAAVAAGPLVRRSTNKRSTWLAIIFGIALALVPSAVNLLQVSGLWTPKPHFAVLSRLDALGFALILFGVAMSLRAASRRGEELRKQNAVLQQEASTDFLTGLLNRRQVGLLLDYGAARARRSGDALGFIMIDLDHFKNVNDTWGHQGGDAVLVHVARLLQRRMRASDMIARYGGEEFLVVLSDPNPDGIVTIADDLRRLIEQSHAEFGGQFIPVTASFGVSVSHVNTEEAVQESIGKADAALYAAKAMGRNRVVGWDQAFSEGDDAVREHLKTAQVVSAPTFKIA